MDPVQLAKGIENFLSWGPKNNSIFIAGFVFGCLATWKIGPHLRPKTEQKPSDNDDPITDIPVPANARIVFWENSRYQLLRFGPDQSRIQVADGGSPSFKVPTASLKRDTEGKMPVTRDWAVSNARISMPVQTASPKADCLHCQNDIEVEGHRKCPLCDKQFTSGTWSGIDAHWRSEHAAVMSYEEYRTQICDKHRSWKTI